MEGECDNESVINSRGEHVVKLSPQHVVHLNGDQPNTQELFLITLKTGFTDVNKGRASSGTRPIRLCLFDFYQNVCVLSHVHMHTCILVFVIFGIQHVEHLETSYSLFTRF